MPQYENAEDRGGSIRRREAVKQLEQSWLDAGCPENFTVRWTKGKGSHRVLNATALREKLADLENPERAKLRLEQGKLRVRKRRMERE